MIVHKVNIPKKTLDGMPEDERIFLVQMGTILNDIHMLLKLVIFSTKKTDNEVERKAQNSQALSILKILAGKLYEGWGVVDYYYRQRCLSRKYGKSLDPKAKKCYKELKGYFRNSDNLVKWVRHKFASHYDREEVKEQVAQSPDDRVFEWYISDYHGNCLYHMSYMISLTAIANFIDIKDPGKAMDIFLNDILETSKNFQFFVGHCMLAIAQKYLERDFENVEIPDPPDINEVFLPYFTTRSC